MLIALVILVVILAAFVGMLIFLWRFGVVRKEVKPREELTGKRAERSAWSKYMPQIVEGRQWFQAMEPERITIRSDEGLKLAGYYLPAKNSRRTILLLHGYRSDGNSDFVCMLRFLHKQGFNLLVAHQRAHGDSAGKYIGFGVKERYDVLRWIDYINTKTPGQDIFLDGISMGAATVMMALGLYLPANVRGCIADCGYTSPRDVFFHVIRLWFHLPPTPFINILSLFAKLIIGADFRVSSTDALKKTTVPVLFIHGGKDKFVPAWMSEENFEACVSEKQLIIIPEAGHGVSYFVETERLQRQIKAFLDKYSTYTAHV